MRFVNNTDTIKIAVDPYVPRGYCVVLVDGEVVYYGPIGRPLIPFITPEALLLLHQDDFKDGDNFFKKQTK
jgi:hypothetical protein